jgi:3-phosphoshikimate 1-carboxyvinyltransferase
MNLTISPGAPLRGEASLQGDKSLSHRAALFAALAQGESCIDNFLVSGVTRAMLDALTALGISWELRDRRLSVRGRGLAGMRSPLERIDCGNSATTLRLLAGALVAAGVSAVLDGTPGLRARPMRRIVEPLQAMGVEIEADEGGEAPLKLAARLPGRSLASIDYTLQVASAQVKSCLMLAALAARGTTTLHEPGPSRDHTERMLRSMGVPVEAGKREAPGLSGPIITTTISPIYPVELSPLHMTLPGDISAAAFLIVAALITPGSEITLRSVGLNPGRTGLLDALRAMGADLQVKGLSEVNGEPVGDLIVRYSSLHGIQVSGPLVVRMIDEFPAFAIAAAYAQGPTVVSGALELRHKESDRIAAICQELDRLGVKIAETPDGFRIQGNTPPRSGTVQAHGDHRLAMALAIAGLSAGGPVRVRQAEIIAESFPDFDTMLLRLGAHVKREE